MMQTLLGLSVLLLASPQVAPQAPWMTDARAARESALRQRRACVILLYVDGL